MTLAIAHRGASRDRPENTLAAFDEALRQGCDGIEFDVPTQPGATANLTGTPTESGDFEFFVIANPTGDECVNADSLIVEFTLTIDP